MAIPLVPGETRGGITVRARQRWNPTHVLLEAHVLYRVTATGEWNDGGKACDADGFLTQDAPAFFRWLLRRYEDRRRMPSLRWFQLAGGIERRDTSAFALGREVTFTCAEPGELYCFANDVPSAYWNNFGALRLAIRRLP